MLTSEQADAILTRLASLQGEVETHINSQYYAPFSGQPEADLGALHIAYNDGTGALNRLKPSAMTGATSADTWLDLASTVEASMRAISDYSDGASVRDEWKAVTSEMTIEHVSGGLWGIAAGALKGLFSGAPLLGIALVLLLVAFLFLFLKKWKVI